MASSRLRGTRLGPRQWVAIDAVVSVVLLALLTGVALGHPHHSHGLRTLALVLLAPAASLPLAVRRRWPAPVFFAVLAASVAYGITGSKAATVTGVACGLYTVAVRADRRWSLLALAAAEAGTGLNVLLAPGAASRSTTASAFIALVQLAVWVVADGIRRRRAYSASLREHSLREALSEQRLQIARELHDIVSHAMSVVAVQAGVGSHLIATRPDEAAKSLRAIESTARSALSETRSLLSVMREDAYDAASRSPVPGMDSLYALVQRVADAGQPVTLRVEGQPRALPQSLELAVYRVVQEALTNVIRHAVPPVTAAVVIGYRGDGAVVVEVTDNGHGTGNKHSDGGGHGLAGMRERLSLLGGELSAGPRPGGGYRVVARLPAEAGTQ